jgi:hypothetical protein
MVELTIGHCVSVAYVMEQVMEYLNGSKEAMRKRAVARSVIINLNTQNSLMCFI